MLYDQPFYVAMGKGKTNLHTGQRGGYYLPALEPTEDNSKVEIPKEAPDWIRKLWDSHNQLRLDQINLRNTLYNTLKELKARSASKRETFTIKGGDGG